VCYKLRLRLEVSAYVSPLDIFLLVADNPAQEDTFASGPTLYAMIRASLRSPRLATRARNLRPSVPVSRFGRVRLSSVCYNQSSATSGALSEASLPATGTPAASLGPPAQHDAFEVIRHEAVAELSATATLYRHKGTGAELLSVSCSEVEKVFGIAFRTPVGNSRGIPHILEHSVLCGSENYPVKEPFVELLKSSLQTYLNAMTYPDRTVYPVASPNLKDFWHLVGVYLDATLRPRLTPWVLAQVSNGRWFGFVDRHSTQRRFFQLEFEHRRAGTTRSTKPLLWLPGLRRPSSPTEASCTTR
jgi:hypothetical protein